MTMTLTPPLSTDAAGLEAALERVTAAVAACRESIETSGRLPQPVLDVLIETGIQKLTVPRAFGGLGLDFVPTLQVIERLAEADGSVGWDAMVSAGGGIYSAFLPPQVAADILKPADVSVSGSFNAPGSAEQVEGGYILDARWRFLSGSDHATWLSNTAVVLRNGRPVAGPGGGPEVILAFVRPADVTFRDTWHGLGLRGTSSHDATAEALFVPDDHVLVLSALAPRPEHGPIHRLSIEAAGPLAASAVALGLARRAVDAFRGLAATKRTPSGMLLGDRSSSQAALAHAEGLVR